MLEEGGRRYLEGLERKKEYDQIYLNFKIVLDNENTFVFGLIWCLFVSLIFLQCTNFIRKKFDKNSLNITQISLLTKAMKITLNMIKRQE